MVNADCLDYLHTIADKSFELAIVDPPYGIGAETGTNRNTKARFAHRKGDTWDSAIPTPEYFQELRRVSKNQIVWGGNYFNLGYFKHFVVWDKGLRGLDFGDCELAVSSFNEVPRVFTFNPTLFKNRLNKIHPTEKPVALYKWLLCKYAQPGDRILDTHGGSGSSVIACDELGFEMTWIEKDQGYYEAAVARYQEHKRQGELFREEAPKPQPSQQTLSLEEVSE